ncbi:class I SAM-dependent methyltransferase [Actibacterium sp. XHP0104]|uniref:class I SAM-dependent methyltransferase n=1 Tax=Actibacterium sp. XHP0104 TaxID=2984335 RepID=UPI0021E8DE5F|nr:SAM-dependent methyltransferase [Actibacterium sp. XHP0104]MCV2880544.1 SAM-dependent methyltransferase [Actibacterium sp. XHP0104]
MTPLTEIILRRIAKTGPISLADYMADCLLHPEHGYYATRDPFGAAGDFTTAPEISQMFGEMLGLWLAQVWMDQGRPAPFTLAEIGPGRGTLMADILRVGRAAPGFLDAAQVHLVEASATLRQVQRQTLGDHPVTWLDSAGALPDAPLFLVANEFFDALPIRQFQRDAAGWREVQVTQSGGVLAMGLSAPAPIALLDHRLDDTSPGDLVEICPAAAPIVDQIATRIAAHGGAALFIDYGGWHSLGDTLQALKAHQMVDPLTHCGEADLTAHVDFEALARAAQGVQVTPMTPQGVFLERLGITQRAQALARNLSGPALDSHIAAHRRLIHADEMGSLFKSLALVPHDTPMPPGFAA